MVIQCFYVSFPFCFCFLMNVKVFYGIYISTFQTIMYFKYHSNWKELYVVNSSPLFETLKLNAVYSSGLNTWSRLESHCDCLSDSAIINSDNYQHISCETRRILYIIWVFIMINLPCQSYISTGYHATSCALPLPSFQELNSEFEIVYNIANPRSILFDIKISQILLYPKQFCCRIFWNLTTPFPIPCNTG